MSWLVAGRRAAATRGVHRALAAAALVVALAPARAQKPATRDSGSTAPPPMDMAGMMHMGGDPLGVSMNRAGSGTSWIPEAVPLPAWRLMAGGWELMVQGIAFVQYDAQGGPRGDHQLGSLNWAMLMATHELAGGRLQARAMVSLDPLGVSARGYPLLLQSGESYQGEPLRDRQHPHDAFMEIAAAYERPLAGPVGISLYAAPVGEPALGPVAFPMRASAMDNPSAPLGHHWQDATHVTFGVITVGLFAHEWKLEGSLFNGREPDDQRWNLDPIRLDSYSGRLSWSPNAHWSVAGSYGYLKSPDALNPGQSEHRMTASVLNGFALANGGQWSTTLVWGANLHTGEAALSQSALVESEIVLDNRNSVFGRLEHVQKSAEDLVLTGPQSGFDDSRLFDVSALSLGYVRELMRWTGATLGLGAVGTVSLVPGPLRGIYGSNTPLGAMVFLRVRPLGPHRGPATSGSTQ